jgi:hypothetical protein
MNSITAAYKLSSPDMQECLGEPVETLDLDYAISPVREACAFQRRLDKRLTFNELRYFICQDFDHGVADAQTTLQRLWDNGLIRSADDLAFLVAAGVRALSEGGR